MMQQNAAKKRPPGKEREADAKSGSCLSGHARPDQARRRSWRGQAQDSGSQKEKRIRLNRVPLLRAETSSPSTAPQAVSGRSQAVGLVTSSSSSLPCRKQGLKRGHPRGDTEPQAKRRRVEDGPAPQAVSGRSQAVGLVTSSGLPCRKQGLKRGHPRGDTEPQAPKSPPAKRRRLDYGPAQSAGTTSQVALRLSQESQSSRKQTAPYIPPWILPRSQSGPIRVRHILRRQRRDKKPYSRPENQSRTR